MANSNIKKMLQDFLQENGISNKNADMYISLLETFITEKLAEISEKMAIKMAKTIIKELNKE